MATMKMPMAVGTGGGEENKTLLWTNPSPTSNFPQTTVTLSDSIANYDRIRIEVYKAQSFTGDKNMEYDFNVAEFLDGYSTQQYCDLVLGIGNGYARRIAYVSASSIKVGLAYELGGTGSSQSTCIPLNIWGIKA